MLRKLICFYMSSTTDTFLSMPLWITTRNAAAHFLGLHLAYWLTSCDCLLWTQSMTLAYLRLLEVSKHIDYRAIRLGARVSPVPHKCYEMQSHSNRRWIFFIIMTVLGISRLQPSFSLPETHVTLCSGSPDSYILVWKSWPFPMLPFCK